MARGPTQAERALWDVAMRGVRRFRTRPQAAISAPAQTPPAAPAQTPPAAAAQTPPPLPPTSAPHHVPPSRDVDRATLDRLRRGQIALEARIDLHGLTQAEAFPALMGFIANAARGGRRALLVITGKGAVSQGGGILRRNAPAWLMASPIGAQILAVAPAHRRHGGDGAFYVMLRRQRGSGRNP